MFLEVWRLQTTARPPRHCSGENPSGSQALEDARFHSLDAHWCKFPQCAHGLVHPDPADGRPHNKLTWVVSSRPTLADHLVLPCPCAPG
eukprot:7774267-Heterocapsa_arctica.AAC.1